jgi:hypothetical protein
LARKSYHKLPRLQAPAEHVGESLPSWMKPGQGEMHPRLTQILDPWACRTLPELDDATIGRLVRLSAIQAILPGWLDWETAIKVACAQAEDPKRARRAMRALLRRFCAER